MTAILEPSGPSGERMRPNGRITEASFHDEWAASTPLDSVDPDRAFTAPTALENRIILDFLSSWWIPNCPRALDIGCGLGESSVFLAKRGYEVTAADVSPGMLQFTRELAQRHGVGGRVSTHEMAEDRDWPFVGGFDVVYAANVVHHVPDRERFWRNAFEALRPGGVVCTWDPVAYNPVINLYRRQATEVRTADERPLTMADVRLARRYFPEMRVRFTWLLGLALFCSYRLRGMDPNKVRYWKRILEETPASLWWWMPLAVLDGFLTRIPGLGWLGWNIVMCGVKR